MERGKRRQRQRRTRRGSLCSPFRQKLRGEQLERRLVLSLWIGGNSDLYGTEQGPEAYEQRVDAAAAWLAGEHESATNAIAGASPLRLAEVSAADVHAVQKAIVAGDPNGTPPDSPENRIDPNTPNSQFAGVGSLRVNTQTDGFMCTATPISPNHVLTAAHCIDVDDNGTIDAEPENVEFNVNLDSETTSTYVVTASELYIHPDWTGFANPWVNDDVAVIELAEELPADVPIYSLHQDPFLDNEILTLAGYGESGTGVTGYSVAASYVTKRVGKNEAEYYFTDDEGSSAREVFYYDFDAPTSHKSLGNDIETTIGGGDSGGPSFLEGEDGSLTLFGINTFTLQWEEDTPEAPLFGSAGGGMVVYYYIDFISSVIDGSGVFVSPTQGTTAVTEGGATDEYRVVLNGEPQEPVTIDITVDSQLTVSSNQLVFDLQNWNIPQTVVVSAVDDAVIEGPHTGRITHTSSSNDPAYDGNRIDDIVVSITDNDWSLTETPYVDLGTSDNVAWDQPRVAVELIPDAAGTGSVGPTIFNTWLLDTGANSTMAFATAVDDMDDPPYPYETVGKFEEFGVAGPQMFDISAPYRFDFAGSDGERFTLLDTSIISDPTNDLSMLGPWGIVGMSAMVDRVTTFDFSVWTEIDIYDLYMGLEFVDEVPPTDLDRYSIAVDNRLQFEPHAQIVEGTQVPVWADIPFFSGIVVHNDVAAGGNFLFDSGAQLSVLSTRLAKEIGLDSNGDGTLNELDANFGRYEVVGGIGGTVAAPVFLFDEIHVPTLEGPDLVWTDLQWLVLDIAEGLDGVFGFDLMTSGWIEAFAADGKSGYIMQSHLDFRNMGTEGTGTIYVDLNPEASQLIDPNGPGASIIESGGSTTVSEIGVDDTYDMVLTQRPTANVTISLINTEDQLVAFDAAHPNNSFLEFTPENWDQPQTIIVSAVDDEVVEIFHRSSILHVSSSTDPAYDGVGIRRMIANIIDNDYPGVMIIPTDGATEVVEGGTTDTYDLVLTYPPTDDVTLTLEHMQGQVIAVDAAHPDRNYLVYTPQNWNVPQTVLVTAVNDNLVEGEHETYITHQMATNDADYQETFSVQELIFISDDEQLEMTQAIDDVFEIPVKGVNATLDVLANDSGNDLSISAVSQGSRGATVSIMGHHVQYTSAVGFEGREAFTYTISDGVNESTATVIITVGSPEQPYIDFDEYQIESYNGPQIDVEGVVTVEAEGAVLHLVGNLVKAIDLPYTVTPETVLEFDFRSRVEGEVHAVGTDLNIDPEGVFKVYGTQSSDYTELDDYASSAPNYRHYEVALGEVTTGDMTKLWFMTDHDVINPDGESMFANVRIRERTWDVELPTSDILGRTESSGQWWLAQSDGTKFTNSKWTTWSPHVTWDQVLFGDFNGDGVQDIAGRALPGGSWYVARSTGDAFVNERWGAWSTDVTWKNVMVGDVNGDGMDDLVGRVESNGSWYAAISNGTSFDNEKWSRWSTDVIWDDVRLGDFNGDGSADLVGRVRRSGDWWVAESNNMAFVNSKWTRWSTGVDWTDVIVADFNGDGQSDIAGRVASSGSWWIATSDGDSFSNHRWGGWNPNHNWVDVASGDFNGDGRADLVGRDEASGNIYVAQSTGSSFVNMLWGTSSTSVGWIDAQIGDFDGDGRSDVAARDTDHGEWWVGRSEGDHFVRELWGRWSTRVGWLDVQADLFDGLTASDGGYRVTSHDVDTFWSELGMDLSDDDLSNEPGLDWDF